MYPYITAPHAPKSNPIYAIYTIHRSLNVALPVDLLWSSIGFRVDPLKYAVDEVIGLKGDLLNRFFSIEHKKSSA